MSRRILTIVGSRAVVDDGGVFLLRGKDANMGFDTASTAEIESVVPEEWGGMWFFRGALETDHLGVTLLELEAGGKGKEHDETATGQEEVYLVVDGDIEVELEDDTVALEAGEAIRLDPEERRQIHNRGDELARLVLAGAPLSSDQ